MGYKILIVLLLTGEIAIGQRMTSGAILRIDSASKLTVFAARRSTDTILAYRGQNRLVFVQDSILLDGYVGKSTGVPDTLMYINKGNVLTSAKSNLTLNYSQISGGRAYTRPARTIGTVFTPNANRDAFVSYTVSITAAGLQAGAVYLEVSANNTTWVEAARVSYNGTATTVMNLAGIVPAGYYARLRSTGTATIAYLNGIETPL